MLTDTANTVAHFFSIIVFLVLFFLLAKSRKEQNLIRMFLTGDLGRRVNLDWPILFLAKFCSALKIPFIGRGSYYAVKPRQLKKEVLFETLLAYGIDTIQYNIDLDRSVHVTMQVHRRISDSGALQKKLTEALQVPVKVVSANQGEDS